jgi:hypothetical protein
MGFQKSQPVEAAKYAPLPASTSPLKSMDASSPARKAHAHEILLKTVTVLNTSGHGPYGAICRKSSPQSRCGDEPSPRAA